MRWLEGRENVEVIDIHPADAVVARTIVEDILVRGLHNGFYYNSENVLVLFLLL